MNSKFLRIISMGVVSGVIFLFSGCEKASVKEVHPSWELSSEERVWMKKFFEDFMLAESGIYTLWGSKPVTRVLVRYYSQEYVDSLNGNPSEEEKKKAGWVTYDLHENWDHWKKISSRFPTKKYLLLEKPHPSDPEIKMVYFINILGAALTIQEHYGQFQKAVGDDFDPLSAVFEIQHSSSRFWEAVSENSALMGLLFGFGLQNSVCFHWKYWEEHTERAEEFLDDIEDDASDVFRSHHANLRNFTIPIFASFPKGGKDPLVQKYEMEREKIKAEYKGRDFVETTLKKLTS